MGRMVGAPHDEDDLLRTRPMYLIVQRVTLQRLRLLADLRDRTQALARASGWVEDSRWCLEVLGRGCRHYFASHGALSQRKRDVNESPGVCDEHC